jgi:hypothetical protein
MEVDEPDPPGRVRTDQHLVYYISEVLHDAKTRYLEVHKLLYAVLIASRKVRHYFQAHKISVVTSYPLRAVLQNPNKTSNIAKWVTEVAEFELDFVTRHAIKSQMLAEFVADWTSPPSRPGGRIAVRQSCQLWCSPTLTRPSSSMAPHVSREPVWEPCSLLQTGNNSSTWCTLSLKQPTT